MFLDPDAWDAARRPSRALEPATESLDALADRLQQEHRLARHAGADVRWEMDLAGIYCLDCLDSGYHFNMMPYDDFLRVIDGPDSQEGELPFFEVKFLPRPPPGE